MALPIECWVWPMHHTSVPGRFSCMVLATWYMVASSDRVIPPAAERIMAERAGATTVEIESSHVAMISHPDEVTALVREAIAATAS